jgi:hypothetical protein
MKLIRIFVDDETCEGLHSIQLTGEKKSQFDKIFDLWTDPFYVRNYLLTNQDYIIDPHFVGRNISDLATQIYIEARELESKLEEYSKDGIRDGKNKLQMIFRPLYKNEETDLHPVLQRSKATVEKSISKKPILRLYAIKYNENTFILTGGAIKIVEKMDQHPDTKNELNNIEETKKWLSKKGIKIIDDLIFYYE